MLTKRTSKRKRIVRKKRKVFRDNIFRTTRSVAELFTITYNGVVTNTFDSYDFSLGQVPNSTEFTALYDQYRIAKIRMKWLPRMNTFDASAYTAAATEVPHLLTSIDTDDSVLPTTLDEMLQRENLRIHHFSKPFTVTFKPKFAVAAYGGGVFTSYAEGMKSQWIDVASPNVAHYGFKVGTTTYSAANNGEQPVWDVIITYYLEFRKAR